MVVVLAPKKPTRFSVFASMNFPVGQGPAVARRSRSQGGSAAPSAARRAWRAPAPARAGFSANQLEAGGPSQRKKTVAPWRQVAAARLPPEHRSSILAAAAAAPHAALEAAPSGGGPPLKRLRGKQPEPKAPAAPRPAAAAAEAAAGAAGPSRVVDLREAATYKQADAALQAHAAAVRRSLWQQPVAGDGSCFFRAVARQTEAGEETHAALRRAACALAAEQWAANKLLLGQRR